MYLYTLYKSQFNFSIYLQIFVQSLVITFKYPSVANLSIKSVLSTLSDRYGSTHITCKQFDVYVMAIVVTHQYLLVYFKEEGGK